MPGFESIDKRPCGIEPEQVEIPLKDAMHEHGVLALAQSLVHEQLRLLRNVQLLVLLKGRTLFECCKNASAAVTKLPSNQRTTWF